MDRNAIYAVHDKQFKSFLEKVISGRFAEIPFEKAWYEYLYSPGREAFRRERLVKFVFSRLVKAQKDASINGLPLKESSTSLFAVGAYKEIETEEKTISSALDPVLTVLLATHAIDGKTINLAFSTSKYYELLLNYVHFVKKAKMNYLIISMDQETTQLCLYHNIPHYAFHNENEFLEESDDYTSLAFRNVINKRNRLLSNLLRAGYNILQADLDVIFFKNPFPFFFNGDYEYEVQSDDRQRLLESSSSSDTRQPSFDEFVNSGIFYAKGTSRMADFYNILMDTVSEYPTQPEQFLLNTVLQYNELRIKYRIMDPSLFPNGFQYFVLGISQRAGVDPFCLHGDWIGGKEVKKYRLREAGAWSQDSIGYTDKVNGRYLVAFDPTVENNGWNNVRNSIRAGMAIASILGRTLVLPAMYAHHNRSTPVSLDYYLDYNVFSRNFPVSCVLCFSFNSIYQRLIRTPLSLHSRIFESRRLLDEFFPRGPIQLITSRSTLVILQATKNLRPLRSFERKAFIEGRLTSRSWNGWGRKRMNRSSTSRVSFVDSINSRIQNKTPNSMR